MIVCSCNQLTERQVREALAGDAARRPRSPGQVHRCLGCKPDCGRCMRQIRQLFSDITTSDCQIGCAVCPGEASSAASAVAAMTAGLPPGLPVQVIQPVARVTPQPPQQETELLARVAMPGRRQFVVPAAQRFVPVGVDQRPAAPLPKPSPRRPAGATALQLRLEATSGPLPAAAE